MAKKFKDASPDGETAAPGMDVTLPDYIRGYAPEVLAPLAVMEGAPALGFWRELFQPAQTGEGKRRVNEAIRWPYAERLVYLAREFAKLDDRCRRYVVKAARVQIWWRGDDIQRFRAIVEAHQSYRGLSEAERADYRKRLLRAAQTVAGGHGGQPAPGTRAARLNPSLLNLAKHS